MTWEQGYAFGHLLLSVSEHHSTTDHGPPCSISTKCYSKTSNNGPSKKWTTSVQRTDPLPPIDFTIELIHFQTSKKQTPLNSIQRALIGPRLTLANAKIHPKTDSETTPTDSLYTMWMLVDHLSISRHRGLFTRTFEPFVR